MIGQSVRAQWERCRSRPQSYQVSLPAGSDGSLVSIQDDRKCTATSSSSIVVNRWPRGRLLKHILPIPRMLETILHSFIQVALVNCHKLALINNINIKQQKSVESEHLTKWLIVSLISCSLWMHQVKNLLLFFFFFLFYFSSPFWSVC